MFYYKIKKLNGPSQSADTIPLSPQGIGWVLKQSVHVAEQLLTGVISLSLSFTWDRSSRVNIKASQTDSKIAWQNPQITLKQILYQCELYHEIQGKFLPGPLNFILQKVFPKASFLLCKTKISGRRKKHFKLKNKNSINLNYICSRGIYEINFHFFKLKLY